MRAVQALAAVEVPRVFLGGATVGLHLRADLLGDLVRPTKDVDCIVPVSSQLEWSRLEEELRAARFRHDPHLIIRFEREGELYDFLPYGQGLSALLGFDVTFHREAFEEAQEVEIAPRCTVHVARLEYLLATKTAAYRDRGASDPYTSKDLEDLVALLIGSPWRAALARADSRVRDVVSAWARDFVAYPRYADLIDAHIPGGPNRSAFHELVRTALHELTS